MTALAGPSGPDVDMPRVVSTQPYLQGLMFRGSLGKGLARLLIIARYENQAAEYWEGVHIWKQ